MISGSNLFVKNFNPVGDEKCYVCGTTCGNSYLVKNFIKNDFTNRDIVKMPVSEYICNGCITVCKNKLEFHIVDGSIVESYPRNFSWVITKDKNIAYSKSHIQSLREKIVNPPEPPFAIVVAVSGQKQLLFRSVVSNSTDNYPILFEDENVTVSISELNDILALATKICAALGKINLRASYDYSMSIKYFEVYKYMKDFILWYENNTKQLFRLASFLCEPMELCRLKFKKEFSHA